MSARRAVTLPATPPAGPAAVFHVCWAGEGSRTQVSGPRAGGREGGVAHLHRGVGRLLQHAQVHLHHVLHLEAVLVHLVAAGGHTGAEQRGGREWRAGRHGDVIAEEAVYQGRW